MVTYYYYYYLNCDNGVGISISAFHYCLSHHDGSRQTDRQNLQMRWRCQFLSFLLSLVERTPKSVWNSGSSSINPLLNFYPCVYVCVCVFLTKCESFKNPPPLPPSVATQCWLLLHFTWGQSGPARLCACSVSKHRPVEQNSRSR